MNGMIELLDGRRVPFRLPPGFEERGPALALSLRRAEERIEDFAALHGWQEEARSPFIESVEVHATQDGLWQRLVEILGLEPDAPLRVDGLSGGLEKGILAVVAPEEYARVRPEYGARPGAWGQLLAHEIAHRLHIAILGGDEDAMGPRWFYEGFAMVAAGQVADERPFDSAAEAVAAALRSTGRGSYAVYGRVVADLARRWPLPELVGRAGRPDFETRPGD